MEKIDYDTEVEVLLASRRVNTYMANYLDGLSKAGLNEELWQEALEDAIEASAIGVDNEQEFLTFFYIDHFVEDLVEEILGIKLDKKEEEALKKFMFEMREDVDFTDLLSFRVSILEWIKNKKSVDKKAHPNRGTPYRAHPQYNLGNWYALVERISKSVMLGFSKKFALKEAAQTLKSPERDDFMLWFKYNQNRLPRMYDVNDIIKIENRKIEVMT